LTLTKNGHRIPRMHIVTIHRGMYPDMIGGTYTYIYELGRRLAARGHRFDVIASTKRPDPGPPVDLEGMRIHSYAFRKLHPAYSTMQHLAKSYRIYQEIAEKSPVDILSVNDSQLGLKTARSALGREACQVPTFHASAALEYRLNTSWQVEAEPSAPKRVAMRAVAPAYEHWQWRFEDRLLRAARGILVLSEFTKSIIRESFPAIDLDLVRIIPSGVDTGRFLPADDRAAVRARLGLDADATYLITVRNLSPRMGIENLVEAMSDVVASEKAGSADVRLLICGEGKLRPALEESIARLGLGERVTLLGRVVDEDLVRYYQAADLFVLPTTAMEGFGIVTVEALSTNLPVVGTPAGATPEILLPIDQRLVTRDTSAEAIAEGIISWLDWRYDETGTTRYRDTVLAKYSWDHIAGEVESYYEEMLAGFRRS